MKPSFFAIVFLVIAVPLYAQPATDTIAEERVKAYLYYLAADSLKGRGNYTPELERAAYFIAGEFAKDGLRPYDAYPAYLQPFTTKSLPQKVLLPDSLGHYQSDKVLLNVLGLLPGKSKPDEVILFTAHYDHMGSESGSKRVDHIFNGANDDASGTTAVLALAHYYAQRNDNARTLVFCAFAGEELGLYGSTAFSQQVISKQIVAVINIEMIGKNGAAGNNAFYITGSRYSDFDDIVKKNLTGTGIRIVNEPTAAKELFKRSDNYPFALLGIPAHTIMCSDDEDNCYHKTCDEAEAIDITQMTTIIKAIARGCTTLVDGSDTPSRIRANRLY